MSKFSIIVPVYNVEKYLKECLDSIQNQTFTDFECICINDGSTDNSLEILNEYAKKDIRFKVLSQKNQGQGVARNIGIDMASGEYLIFVDPDDWIELNTLEVLDKKFEETKAEVIHFEFTHYNETLHKNRKNEFIKVSTKRLGYTIQDENFYSWKDFTNEKFMASLTLNVTNKAYLTKFIKDNNIKFALNKCTEDHIFTLSTILLAEEVYFTNTYLYNYRTRIGSAVNSASDINFCIFDNIELFKQFLIKNNLFAGLEKHYKAYAVISLSRAYRRIPTKSLRKFQKKASEILTKEEYKQFIKLTKGEFNFLEHIFSIKNKNVFGVKTKFIKIFGFEFNIKKIFSISDENEYHTLIQVLGVRIRLTKKKYKEFRKQKSYQYYKKNKIDITTIPPISGVYREVQLAGLYLLDELDYVCNELGIEYWIDFGALIGAVRHKGFIPWDDDIDVGIMRDDYDKLIENFDKIKRDSNLYLDFNVNINRKHSLLKLCYKGSEHLFVDIFPYDMYTKKLSDEEQIIQTKIHKQVRRELANTIVPDKEKGKELHDTYSVLRTEFNNKNLKDVDVIWGYEFGHRWKKWIHSHDTIYPLQKIEFEGKMYPCINNPDKYLTDVYGNYMNYPKKFTLGHFVFIDFPEEELKLVQELAKKRS